MNTPRNNSLQVWLSFALGLAVSLYGLSNVLPAIGDFRLGPFPMYWFRPTFFALCVGLVWVNMMSAEKPSSLGVIGFGLLAVVGLFWGSYEFYFVARDIDDAMFLFGTYEMWVAVMASAGALYFCWRIWGLPVAILGIIGVAYMWTGHHWPGPLQTVNSGVEEMLSQNLLFSLDTGMMGSTFSIVITTVLPFIILGAVLEGVGAGESMIRIAFYWMRRTAGGPAYAAIASSSLFGTVSGSAVANVVGTGVVTIPMIKRRGYTSSFAGAVEASASTGGQIMPPIMGAAALVMADFAGVGYLTIIIAILVPVIAYYASLMTMVYFETKRLGIQPNEEDIAATPVPQKQDYLNLLMIFGPLLVIVYLLIQGMSPAGASITALALLFPLSLVNPAIRQRPFQLIQCLANGGSTFAGLLMAIAAVSIVISALSATGVPVKFGVVLNSMVTDSLLVSLLIAAVGCVILGMGMPTLPAYVTVATIAIPAMQILGLDPLTAHMFVLMIAIGSSITPPVAIAAYAAATISGGKPIRTSVDASRIGVMMFLIPFMFAYNPMMLSVDQPNVQFAWLPWFWVVGKLLISIPLLSTALIGFDNRRLSLVSVLLRICCVVLMFVPDSQWDLVGIVGAIVLVLAHRKFSFHQDSPNQGAAS
jgi:TRAP transporter 4TM/12TM fusion protein